MRRLASIATAACLTMLATTISLPAMAQTKVDINVGAGTQGGSQYPITVSIGTLLEKMPQIGRVTLQPGGACEYCTPLVPPRPRRTCGSSGQ